MHNHAHSHFGDASKQTLSRLALSLGLTLAFVVFEAAAGVLSNSLALLTDAAHNVTDVIALALSWYAVRLATRPSNASKTYGYHRAGILAALINATTLVVISLVIFYEGWQRLFAPPEVQSGILIGVGLVAFFINLGTALLVKKGSEHDLNMRAAFIHMMGDVLSTVGTVIAGVLIYFTGANWLDALVSMLISGLILWNAWGILRETVDILLEATPRDVDMAAMIADVIKIDGVLGVHDLHVWSISSNLRTMSAHILTDDISISSGAIIQAQVNEVLAHHYNIAHATLQLECSGCAPDVMYCNIAEAEHHEHEEVRE